MAIKKTVKKPAAKKPAPKKVAKAPVKKVAKTTAAKVVKASKPAKPGSLAVKAPYTKSQVIAYLADVSNLKRKDVVMVMDGVMDLMAAHLSKKGPGEFNLAGMLKCRVINKPATKARNGINPFTGQPTTFAAKPARNVLKIRPLKKLKEVTA